MSVLRVIPTCTTEEVGAIQCMYTFTALSTAAAEFLDEIQTKVLRVVLLAIHSHLYSFALIFIFLQTHATSYSFYSSVTAHCKG